VRTSAQTGATFTMADLLTSGHAYKAQPKVLPSTAAKMAVLAQTEQTLPGDIRGEAPYAVVPVIDRMARVIRSRNLDLLNLMDDFLKRPRGSRMPVRNRAFLDVSTFKRALCYAFGDQVSSMMRQHFSGLGAEEPHRGRTVLPSSQRHGTPTWRQCRPPPRRAAPSLALSRARAAAAVLGVRADTQLRCGGPLCCVPPPR
jgi:hypothetical protein